MEPHLLSLIGFAVAMYITPGPNNIMLASAAANHGVRATVPHMLGIAFGFGAMLQIVFAGLGSVLLAVPALLSAMRWIGAAWLTWLAWQIASAPPPQAGEHRPILGFWGAAAFQWINPKAWLIGLGAASEFTRPDVPLSTQLLWLGIVFFGVAIPCMLPWLALGKGAALLLRSPFRLRIFNVAMGLLLIASLVPLLVGL